MSRTRDMGKDDQSTVQIIYPIQVQNSKQYGFYMSVLPRQRDWPEKIFSAQEDRTNICGESLATDSSGETLKMGV